MHKQYNEEIGHAMKFFNFIIERGGRVQLQKIDEPPNTWDSPLAAFEAAYKHEVYISGRIHDLVKISAEENDLPAHYFLAWFVDEQVEEEASTDEVVQHLKMVGDSKGGLLMLDHRLGKRGQE
jgi:ferritin